MSAPPGLVIAAPASGSGKTVVTLAILHALARAGVRTASCKVGPDYIDPAFHAAATGRPCFNLDLWAMRPETATRVLDRLAAEVDLIVCEGAMGLFDGAADGTGSSADVAAATGWPVVLVVDVRRQGASVAALLRGFATHRADVKIAGIIFNQVGGESHAEILQRAVAPLGIPVLGCLPRSPVLVLAERHLGLVQAAERTDLQRFLTAAADLVERHLDLAQLRAIARPAHLRTPADDGREAAGISPIGQRIAVAQDVAFAFAYALLLEDWRAAGAELSFFSPLANEAPRSDAEAIYLPGGYPELHAGRLAGSSGFLEAMRTAARAGATVYGECGGYMVLGDALIDADGQSHAMAGLLPVATSFADRRLHLGYRSARLLDDGPLGARGTLFRGHEFHYAVTCNEGAGERLFACADSSGRDRGPSGLRRGSICGSFLHLIDRAHDGRAAVAG